MSKIVIDKRDALNVVISLDANLLANSKATSSRPSSKIKADSLVVLPMRPEKTMTESSDVPILPTPAPAASPEEQKKPVSSWEDDDVEYDFTTSQITNNADECDVANASVDEGDAELPLIAHDRGDHDRDSLGWVEDQSPPPSEDVDDMIIDIAKPIVIVDVGKYVEYLSKNERGEINNKEEVISSLQDLFINDHVSTSELLFSINAAIHTTELRFRRDINELFSIESNLDNTYDVLEYPDEINGVNVWDLWSEVVKPSEFECVNILKEHVRECHRDIVWKAGIAKEIERLARDAATLSLMKVKRDVGNLTKSYKLQKQGAADIDVDLAAALNSHRRVDYDENNILTKICAMIFQRLRVMPGVSLSDHFGELANEMAFIRQSWIEEIGMLPEV
jgi:hypothetical protein